MQVVTAEHLVPPACDRLIGGRDTAEQHIAQRVTTFDQSGTSEIESAGSIVQQRRIGWPKRGGHRAVALVAG